MSKLKQNKAETDNVTAFPAKAQPVKVAIGRALTGLETLKGLMSTAKFPASDAFLVARMIAKLSANAELIAADQTRSSIVHKYGTEGGGQVMVTPDKIPAFLEEWLPIANQEIDLDIRPLPVAILERAFDSAGNPIRITPNDALNLTPLLEE